jgi:hypothetical protein
VASGSTARAGGIFWRENDCETSNACSTAPTAVCSVLLYEATGDERYLERAKQLYDWTVRTLVDTDGAVFDSIDVRGNIDKRKFSYNTGVLIWAAVKLYEVTKDKRLLDDAVRFAAGGMSNFVTKDASGNDILSPMPWFNVYLLRGLTELDKHVCQRENLLRINAALDRAYRLGRADNGLYRPDWGAGRSREEPYYHQGLDSIGAAECFALLIPYDDRLSEENADEKAVAV